MTTDESRELTWLRRVRDLSQQLASERDLGELYPKILDAAIEITGAERGFLVRLTGKGEEGRPNVKVEVARGFDREELSSPEGRVSRTVVERVLARDGRGLVTTSEEDEDIMEVSSVKARRVLSILCTPLRLRGETRGVLYLDHRFTKAAFTDADLPLLSVFADQAALAMETAELLADRSSAPRETRAALEHLDALESVHERGPTVPSGPTRARFGTLVGRCPAMAALYEEIERAARSAGPVLILGEEGTGKLSTAREIHERSSRSSLPFLVIDCTTLSEAALTRELLGDEGSGGRFSLAGKGTLVLRGIEALSPALQATLVGIFQQGEVKSGRGGAPRQVQCRVMTTSSSNLREFMESGTFRRDLYFQLDVMRLVVPPLRQRVEDLPLLLEAFDLQARDDGPTLRFSERAVKLLNAYTWPGNLRELKNEVLRLKARGEPRVSGKFLSDEIREGRGVAAPGNFAGMTLGDVEREMVRLAVDRCGGNKARAARQLGIPRSTLYHLIQRHGL